jgi:hypothetical protein
MMPVLSLIEQSLRSGYKVWVVGDMMLPSPGEYLPMEALRPDINGVWAEMPYYELWSKQMGAFMMSHAKESRENTPKIHNPVNGDERLQVLTFEGWQN